MEMRTLGRTGLSVSALGLGGAEIGEESPEFEAVVALLNTALDEGLNVIDTAECYGVGEELIGRVLSPRRREFNLFTKTGHASGIDLPDWDPRLIATQIDRSLQRLKTDRVELLQLHSCGLEILRQGDVIAALQKVREVGKARFLGYSGDGQAAEYAITCGAFDTLQTSLNVFDQYPIETTLPLARQHNMGVICKRPIGNAVWRHATRPEKSFHHRYWDRMQVLPYEFLRESEQAAGVALRFTLGQEGVHTAIVGTKNPEHWHKNAAALAAGPLSEAQMRAIRDRWKAAEASLPQ
jgi:aryl-alcohol dehydrogenase-like predicted oxidoreductase